MASVEQLVFRLVVPERRENAMRDLSRKIKDFPDLALILWSSRGTIGALLQEIVSIYPLLSPPTVTASDSNRVCDALALFQCVASHQETSAHFRNASIPTYVYPFLNTVSKTTPFENLRLSSLGVIGGLVRFDNTEAIKFVLSMDIIPLCLRTMELDNVLTKKMATFIIRKILHDDFGLAFICDKVERFSDICDALGKLVRILVDKPSAELFQVTLQCYLHLSENRRGRETLKTRLPDLLSDGTFSQWLRDQATTRSLLTQLLTNVGGGGQVHLSQLNGIRGDKTYRDNSDASSVDIYLERFGTLAQTTTEF